MDEQLLAIIVAGYPVCLLLGWLVGNVSGHAYERGRNSHWTDGLTGGIWIVGLLATIVMLVNLVTGFVESVQPKAVATTITKPATSSTAEPYGGCDEAWQAPKSEGAKWCRDHGFVVETTTSPNR